MLVSKLRQTDLTDEVIDKILYEGLAYNGESAPCAMVLGSMKAAIYRVPVAEELYKTNKVQKVLLCGGAIQHAKEGVGTEAQRMKERAIELGIHEADILMEEVSTTTKENIICALLPLEREFKLSSIRKLILVTTNYHMRRSILMAQTYMPNWIHVISCPAEDMSTRRDNWSLTEKGRQRAMDEAWKIICYIIEGSIPDFNI